MYEMLGLSVSNFAEVSSDPINIESENENEFEAREEQYEEASEPSDNESLQSLPASEYNNELVKSDKLISPLKNIDEFQGEENENQVKRPFLKRGAGLTTRFRIPPDAFNLKKLPPYKYNERVRRSLGRAAATKTSEQPKAAPPARRKSEPENVQKASKKLPSKPLPPPLAKLPTAKPPAKPPTPESVDLVIPPNVGLKVPTETKPNTEEPQIEDWFQSRFKAQSQPEMSETPKIAKIPKGISWAKILSSNNIADSSVKVDHLLNSVSIANESDMDETDLFHLLEEKVNTMSLDVSMSTILRLLTQMRKPEGTQSEADHTLVNPEDPIIKDPETVSLHLQPHPADVEKPIVLGDTTDEEDASELEQDEDDEEQEEEEEEEETPSERNRVRFADKVELVNAVDLSTDIEGIELSQTSTPNEKQKFQDFKRQVFGQRRPPPEAIPQRCDQLKEQSDLMKAKLTELQHEIASVRQQNSVIMKMRQELELEKIQLDNEREDMIERMKDDRIKMEIQLHDERLKFDQEKQKFEKAQKNPSKKEREEIVKLKEAVEELKDELKTKEARHGSTSSRFRSQVKLLEKENQSMKLELEVLKKENKKLELENARLRKDTNSKMLQEINRNIAKLAPQEAGKKQPETSKKPAPRRSEPQVRKRVKSVPDLVDLSSSSSSSDEEILSSKSKENNPTKIRRSDPVKISQTSTPCDVLGDMKREIVNSDGSKDIWYPNGNLKKISADGMLIRMLYYNRDIKETNINEGTVKYYYHDTNTWHTTYIDGMEILEYAE